MTLVAIDIYNLLQYIKKISAAHPKDHIYLHMFYSRNSGMDSRQAILPDALWVNANLFHTDLCRDPEHRDVKSSSKTHAM